MRHILSRVACCYAILIDDNTNSFRLSPFRSAPTFPHMGMLAFLLCYDIRYRTSHSMAHGCIFMPTMLRKTAAQTYRRSLPRRHLGCATRPCAPSRPPSAQDFGEAMDMPFDQQCIDTVSIHRQGRCCAALWRLIIQPRCVHSLFASMKALRAIASSAAWNKSLGVARKEQSALEWAMSLRRYARIRYAPVQYHVSRAPLASRPEHGVPMRPRERGIATIAHPPSGLKQNSHRLLFEISRGCNHHPFAYSRCISSMQCHS